MSRKKSRIDRHISRAHHRASRAERLRPLASLLAVGLSAPAFADPSVPFPTYQTGPQPDGSWVVGNGQIVNPAGTQVDLGIRVRAKAIALNPNTASHTAAVLVLGASQAAVEVFNTQTGQVVQNYSPFGDSSGSYSGIAYSADGKYLLFSQDSSFVAVANVLPSGLLTDLKQVSGRRTTVSSSASPTARSAITDGHTARSIARIHRIRAGLRSRPTARAPMRC
jgi:hypothetical protein